MSSLLVIFVWGGGAILKLLQNMVYSTIHHPTPPPSKSHTFYTYCTFSLGRWEGEEVREKIEGQQYTRIVPSSMGATVHMLGQKYQP